MNISKKEVLYIADLSRLNVTDEEADALTEKMEAFIGFANMLSELDTSHLAADTSISLQNVFREDCVTPSYDANILLENAPCRRDGYYLAPDVKRKV